MLYTLVDQGYNEPHPLALLHVDGSQLNVTSLHPYCLALFESGVLTFSLIGGSIAAIVLNRGAPEYFVHVSSCPDDYAAIENESFQPQQGSSFPTLDFFQFSLHLQIQYRCMHFAVSWHTERPFAKELTFRAC